MVANTAPLQIRPLTAADAATFRTLRLQALHAHPDAFGASVQEQSAMPVSRMAEVLTQPHQYVLGAWQHAQLVGTAALQQRTATKMVHIADVWGMYVDATHRCQGIGDQMLAALMTYAHAMPALRQVQLCVASHNHRAIALYQRHGFVRWGTAPQQLHVDGQYFDEDHMVCLLHRA